MEIQRDPQNSIADTIDNALRGALIHAGMVKTTPGDRWTSTEEAFLADAVRAVMAALGISDAVPTGVWVILNADDSVHSVHLSELKALRIPQASGYYMTVKFIEFGKAAS